MIAFRSWPIVNSMPRAKQAQQVPGPTGPNGPNRFQVWFLHWQLMDMKLSEGALHLEHCLLNECGPDDIDIDEAQALVEAE